MFLLITDMVDSIPLSYGHAKQMNFYLMKVASFFLLIVP